MTFEELEEEQKIIAYRIRKYREILLTMDMIIEDVRSSGLSGLERSVSDLFRGYSLRLEDVAKELEVDSDSDINTRAKQLEQALKDYYQAKGESYDDSSLSIN